MARVRSNVWNLSAGDETLAWYGRAVGEMLARPITDPTSWRFQAAMHDYVVGRDPLAQAGEALPPASIQQQFWRQCQHGSWFFLPWHRMYLHFFEEIVAAAVVSLGGPADWALPYWDYSSPDPEARLLPEPFRSRTMPDGSPNSLFVEARDPRANEGEQIADEFDVELEPALTEAFFSDPILGNFGGLPSNFSHTGSGPGQLERVPHGSMHVAVGGPTGWMSRFNTAALDPVFWLHHANIDRLWEVWLRRDPAHRNPTSLQWLNMIPFYFHDADGQVVEMRCAQVVDTTALGYTYEDVSDPLAGPGLLFEGEAGTGEVEAAMPSRVPPELVGASGRGVQVRNEPVRIQVPTPAPVRDAAMATLAEAGAPETPHVLLQLENLTADGPANSYDVYVDVPPGEDPRQHPGRRAGRLDLFGVEEASLATDQHPGSGLTYTLDISRIYQSLTQDPDWDPESIEVSLVPVRAWEGTPVTVGRVSVFFG